MTTITTRSGKGSPLTNNEVDANFTNLNDDKVEASGDSMTGNLSFGDNNKAIFGAGSDLQIYHDGSHSYVSDQGTGNLRVLAENFQVRNPANNEAMIIAIPDSGVTLYHDNATKLATTSTGIDVTGTVTADGLNVDAGSTSLVGTLETTANNSSLVYADSSQTLILKNTDASGTARLKFLGTASESGAITFGGGVGATSDTFAVYPRVMAGGKAFNITGGGDISFYEDTGTTAKFFWDASAESLGIGTSSPSGLLHIASTGASNIKLEDTDNGFAATELNVENGGRDFKITTPQDTIFVQGSTEAMRIDSSGNLLVGQTSGSSADAGHIFNPVGVAFHVRDGGIPLVVDRLTSDGDITTFRKDGTVVGNIGTTGGDMYVGTGDTGIRFDDATNHIRPCGVSGANLDATIDIGDSTRRFKDLYLSANAYAGTYRHEGDSDTYLNFPADNNISLVTGGAEIVRAYQIAGAYGVLRVNGSGSATYPNFTFNGDDNTGMYRAGTDTLAFTTAGSEAVRIDSSGNLLVGQTSNSETGTGIGLVPDGTSHMYSGSTDTLMLGRGGTDGDILSFNKSGTTVGSIATWDSDFAVGQVNVAFKFDDGGNQILPWSVNTNLNRDNAIDLGDSTSRWKDLYLSGGAYLGGTGSANKLDDYEEGTWTVVITGETSGSVTTTTTGYYTKVGHMVTCAFYLNESLDLTSISGVVNLSLPFTSNTWHGGGSLVYANNFLSGSAEADTSISVRPIAARARLVKGSSTDWIDDSEIEKASGNKAFMFHAVFEV